MFWINFNDWIIRFVSLRNGISWLIPIMLVKTLGGYGVRSSRVSALNRSLWSMCFFTYIFMANFFLKMLVTMLPAAEDISQMYCWVFDIPVTPDAPEHVYLVGWQDVDLNAAEPLRLPHFIWWRGGRDSSAAHLGKCRFRRWRIICAYGADFFLSFLVNEE